MKLTLIRPNMFNTKSHDAMQPLAISILSGLTPKEVEVEFFDDRIEELPGSFETDLVALSVETFNAKRAYQIAVKIRAQGIPVVMGGIHPTFLPEEALRYCDSVIVGEAEGLWEKVIDDFRNKRLKKIYRQEEKPLLNGVVYDRSIFKNKKYAPLYPVQFGRGCKYSCDFCSVNAFFGSSLRQRPVGEVIQEIAALHKKNLFIVDDNILSDDATAKSFLEALIPLKIKWSSQASIDIVNKPELLKLMSLSGCSSLTIGFESLDHRNLKLMGKGVNIKHNDYALAVQKLSDYGIMVYGTFIFGYDYDTKDSFDQVFEFAMRNKLMLANFNPLIPMPGTHLYQRLNDEGRLIFDKWWLDPGFKYGHAVYHPKGMSSDDLTEGCFRLRKNFNTYHSIGKRMFDKKTNCSSLFNLGLFIASNVISRKEILKKQGVRLGDSET